MSRILVIEDDSRLRANICELLVSENYDVENAENGLIGLEKANHFFPDLIISDIMMPQMNGFELLKELLKKPETSTIPLIFLSAKAEPEHLREGMNLGADDYLFKPFRITDLLNAVETRLKKKEVTEQRIREVHEQVSRKIPHELRTPLVPILGFSAMIDEEDDVSEIKEMAKVIKSNGKKLHQKIEKFILYNDLVIEEKKNKKIEPIFKTTNFDQDVIYQCLSELEEKLKPNERVKINVEFAKLKLPEFYLTTVIKELVENSLKYSEENSQVIIEGKSNREFYHLSVSDSGRGIAESKLNSIKAFEKFGKQQFTEPGFGLGLTIVKKIVSAYNCNFSIKSELNIFTNSEIIIPLEKI
jgi:CheY-like chemotaxis protein